MRILVTGGTVFVSRYTAEFFVKKGHEVCVLNRNSRPQPHGVRLIECDRHKLGNRLKIEHFDLIIDVTAYNETDVNDLLDGLGDFGLYVMISSSAVYPETLPQPFREDMTLGENIHWGDYGTNKIAAEKALFSRVPGAYVLRPPYLYGAMNNLCREAFVFQCAEEGRVFYIPESDLKLQFFDVEDLCRLIERIAELRPEQHILNVGDPEPVTVSEWVRKCYGVLGKIPEIRYVSADVDVRQYFPFRDYEYALDVTAQTELLPDLKPLEQGLHESCDWWKNNREFVVKKGYIGYIEENLSLIDQTKVK